MKVKCFLLFQWTGLIFVCLLGIVSGGLNPVVFIPGDGGSQVEAKLNKSSVVHYVCQKTSNWFNIWLNMELLVPIIIDCWVDNVKLTYDNVTRTTKNAPGVDVRIPGWGSSETVEWLDPSHASTGAYFKDIGDALVKLGYTRNVSIKGAPYDFRKGPNENQDFHVRLKKLIEDTYTENGNEKIMLIVHSMGGPMSMMFLHMQTQEWKDKYIKCLISLSGAYAGTVKSIKVYAVGDDLGSHVLSESIMKQMQITSPSLAWMLPSNFFWKNDEILVETDRRNYTLDDLKDYFYDLNYPNGWEMAKDVEPYTKDFSAPGVEVHCLYGSKVPTVERLYYKRGTWLDGYPTLINGDGDGTVNIRSLESCRAWQGYQKQKVYLQPFQQVDHMAILRDSDVIRYITNLVNEV